MSAGATPYAVSRGGYDEAVAPDGSWREPWAAVAKALGGLLPAELTQRQRRIDLLLDAEGAGHLVHELSVGNGDATATSDSRPWRLDPLPLVLSATEFDALAAAAVQRWRMLDALLQDVFGPRTLIRDGVLPAPVVFALEAMTTRPPGAPAVPWLVHYAVDVVRSASGEWRVVRDLTDMPPGLGYTVLNRSVMARVVGEALRATRVAPVGGAVTALRRALHATAPPSTPSPRTVVMSAGPEHPTYLEHSYLAVQMGFHLAESADLVVRGNRAWLRALDGLEPVDVIHRCVPEDELDPLEQSTRKKGGVPAIIWAAQRGGVVLVNRIGSRLAEDVALAPYLGDVAQALLGERLRLASVDGHGALSTVPTWSGPAGFGLEPCGVVIRLHVIAEPGDVTVVRGGVGRVLGAGENPRAPSRKLVKDVWVLGGGERRVPTRIEPPPQIDLRASVTTRAANALYWMGRAAERAEAGARAARWVAATVDQDPEAGSVTGSDWEAGAIALLRAARALPFQAPDAIGADRLATELRDTRADVARRLGTIVHEAMSVREYLSLSTGRVLGDLARAREELLTRASATEDLDIVLIDLAALAGLWTESTVRGPSWRFLDLGRRLERALVVLGTIEAGLGIAGEGPALQPLAEAVLSMNESLVAYRRRYRSDIDVGAVVDMLVHDDGNPRGLVYQLDRMREDFASLGWQGGVDLVQEASLGALGLVEESTRRGRRLAIDALVLAARAPLLALGSAIDDRWFAVPVSPTIVGGRAAS